MPLAGNGFAAIRRGVCQNLTWLNHNESAVFVCLELPAGGNWRQKQPCCIAKVFREPPGQLLYICTRQKNSIMCNVVHMSSPANRVNLGWKQSVPQGGFQDLHTMLQIKTFTPLPRQIKASEESLFSKFDRKHRFSSITPRHLVSPNITFRFRSFWELRFGRLGFRVLHV